MKTLIYNELDPARIPNLAKVVGFLQADDFHSAEVKKLGHNLYRAKLDKSNRLLFAIYSHQGERYALLLEWIAWHAYDKSRFLANGAVIDEAKIPTLDSAESLDVPAMAYVNPHQTRFHLLDKVLSFDQAQADIYALPAPLIIIGSAGSGKTALTLEKMKQTSGDILYLTRSPYLVHNSRQLYFAAGYANEQQKLDFLSFQEYLESIQVPEGRELSFREFADWHARQRMPKGLKDAHQLFEEFKGVITGPVGEDPYLSREEYLGLGVKQSIFPAELRGEVHGLFIKYLEMMQAQGRYDANILSHRYLEQVEPRYDFIVVDEVQDLTTIQLNLVLKSLRHTNEFLLCGDSNQIVHPNFFSWSKVKSYFHNQEAPGGNAEIIRILNTNYRNSPEVTEIANRVLKVKSARFGSVDKESNYLVHSNAHNQGVAVLLRDEPAVVREIDQKTRTSTRFAVLVMHPEQKTQAKRLFGTPLVFSVQEAKGLEYENIILFNFISADSQRFFEICREVSSEALQVEELTFSRAKDKGDKSLEIYKFHINALYVAITRAVKNLYLIESEPEQRLFELLGIQLAEGGLALEQYASSLDEWRAEAHRLELQGKQEQAEEIRSAILKQKTPNWPVLKGDVVHTLREAALAGDKKARVRLFEYAMVYHDQRSLNQLHELGFAPALKPDKWHKELVRKHYLLYDLKNTSGVLRQVDDYGVDFRNPFNQTPLMVAARMGKDTLMEELLSRGADTSLVDNIGLNAFQLTLERAVSNPKYAQKQLAAVYTQLEPDSLTLQIDGRLVKLDNRQAEFLLFNLMMVLFYTLLGEKIFHDSKGGIESKDLEELLANFPTRIVPDYRKRRQYLSSILAKNEVERDDRYNRKLFKRLRRGHYIINPTIKIRVEGEWVGIYELLKIEMVAPRRLAVESQWFDYNDWSSKNMQRFEDNLQRMISNEKVEEPKRL